MFSFLLIYLASISEKAKLSHCNLPHSAHPLCPSLFPSLFFSVWSFFLFCTSVIFFYKKNDICWVLLQCKASSLIMACLLYLCWSSSPRFSLVTSPLMQPSTPINLSTFRFYILYHIIFSISLPLSLFPSSWCLWHYT